MKAELPTDACQSGIKWFNSQNTDNAGELFNTVIKSNDYGVLEYANWYLSKKLNKINRVKYAVYAAENVIHIYEDKYPNNAIRQHPASSDAASGIDVVFPGYYLHFR